MSYKLNYLLFIILFINIKYLKTFNVKFHYNYNLEMEPFNTKIYKRELTQFFDKASFSFNGFEKVGSIPVIFPIDICMFNLEDHKYAAVLHMKRNGERYFKVLKNNNGSYELIADKPTPIGIAMDCIKFNNKGYVAIAFNLTKHIQYVKEGSPIYEIAGNNVKAVQYFAAPNLTSVYLRTSGNEFFLLHTYANFQDTYNLHCPYFKWHGSTFNKMGHIPCSNARQLAPFSIDYESYVAVANYADQNGRTYTNSEIYKYSRDKKKFVLFQRIKTNGAVDVKYFSVPQNEVKRKHFLVFGNSISTYKSLRVSNNLDADSVFYLFDKGQFIPYQKLSLYAVKKFLPIQNVDEEKFILLVSCTDQDIKIYNFNDWKFEESKVQFTGGALGKGVSNMRIYQENEKTYLIIANTLMGENETNLFFPIFKQEQHANALRQQIIDWVKSEIQHLQTVNTKYLRKRVEEKLKHFEQLNHLPKLQDISKANVKTVTTNSLVYPKLKMSNDYWMALNYISQALDSLEITLKQKQRIKRAAVDLPTSSNNIKYVHNNLNVKTLIVNKKLKVEKSNKVNAAKPEFENISAQKVRVNGKYIKPFQERLNAMGRTEYKDEDEAMIVKNLQINGKLNAYLWSDLLNHTLKRKEKMQFLEAPIEIETLKSDAIVVNDDKVNEQDLGALIPINRGKYVINQDIQFSEPITVNQLQIFERLNNLHVFNGQFDVLLKKSNKTQVIEGLKNISNIKVVKPITITGKIIGRQQKNISPNKFVHEPLILQGNYVINSDMHINQHLNTLDLIDLREKFSTKQILDIGICMDENLKDVNLKFRRPLIANSSIISFANQNDLQRLVKLNINRMQVIEGAKVFNEHLEIRGGFTEVKYLNGVDMEELESKIFLKNSNQTIEVAMKIGKVSVKSLQSPIILLNYKDTSDYLTTNGNQSVQGSLSVENLKAQTVSVVHLNTAGRIFSQNLQDIHQQNPHKTPAENVFKEGHKFHGSIYVQNLILNSTINNKPVKTIENQIFQLEGNIKYVGNLKFNYPMDVINITFQGKLNGIPAKDIGKCWLQKRTEKQVFTIIQTFASIKAKSGIQLQGKLNGFTMEDFYTKTYWINRNEYIQCINFENPLEISTHLSTKTLNDYMVPQHMFYKTSKDEPIILNSMKVVENFIAEGSILNLTSINKLKLSELQDFLNSYTVHTLYVDSAYFFESPPSYKTLNSHYVKKTLDYVWLTNENVVLPQHAKMLYANFEGLLEFEGSINNMNIDYLRENYFSKSKPQYISGEIVFSKGTESEMDVNINDMQVFGTLTEVKSGFSFNFNEFVQNTLKTSGPHLISGSWSLLEAIIEGNLNEVLVNRLNLMDDILHELKPALPYQLKAPKIFKNVYIENLYADSSCIINRVPVARWIEDTVYLYENYTIKGVITIDYLNVYNNLFVFGKLNNITYNENNLLLQNKQQHIPGNIIITSHLAKEKRFLTINIEDLYSDYINRNYLPTLIEELIPTAATTEIKSHLSFKHVIIVERYEGPEEFLIKNQWTKYHIGEHTKRSIQNTERSDEMMQIYTEIKECLKNISKSKFHKLRHFHTLQIIQANFAELVMLSFRLDTLIVDILAVIDAKNKNVTIYKWIPKKIQFRKTKELEWVPQDPLLLKIIHKWCIMHQQPIDSTALKAFIRNDLKDFYKVLSNTKNVYNHFEFINETCCKYHISMNLYMFCLNTKNSENIFKSSYKIQQIESSGKHMCLLTNTSVLIYNVSLNSIKMIQKLAVVMPKLISLGSFKNCTFLAVLNAGQTNASNCRLLEIYKFVNSSSFALFQSLKCFQPVKITFSFIEKSDDFLLHILNESADKPYLIYQYRGIMGFQEIFTDSVPSASLFGFNILKMFSSENYLVALKSQTKITVFDLAFNEK